MIEVINS